MGKQRQMKVLFDGFNYSKLKISAVVCRCKLFYWPRT